MRNWHFWRRRNSFVFARVLTRLTKRAHVIARYIQVNEWLLLRAALALHCASTEVLELNRRSVEKEKAAPF